MDSGPTLDVIDGYYGDEEEEDEDEVDGGEREVWGRLFPLIDAYSKTGEITQIGPIQNTPPVEEHFSSSPEVLQTAGVYLYYLE